MARDEPALIDPGQVPGSPRGWRYLGYILLGLSILVTAAFLLSNWLINADNGGRHDLGMAIAMAFGSVLGIYASIILATIDFLAALIGTLARLRSRPIWLATVVALVPVGWVMASG